MDLPDGTVALVTGGGTGIGKGIAKALAGAGAAVALAGRRHEVIAAAAEEIREEGGEAIAVQADVAQEDDAERLVAAVAEKLGALHVLVNNAGIARVGPLAEMTSESIDAVIDVDLKGPIWMIRAALPELSRHRESGRASVINVSSSVTLNVVPNYSVYSAAKAGVDMLTRCLARDLAPMRIRVNAINPGVVETPIFSTMLPENAVGRAMRSAAELTPLGRIGLPADVAGLALFLAGPASSWMTGAVIALDGGISLAS
jgi:3-oxoacyl-[acyl-carrier protein] reductase